MWKEIKTNQELPDPVILISFWKKASWPRSRNSSLECTPIWLGRCEELFFLRIQEVKTWNSNWKPPQRLSDYLPHCTDKETEVWGCSRTLGSKGRWGCGWRARINTEVSHHPNSCWPRAAGSPRAKGASWDTEQGTEQQRKGLRRQMENNQHIRKRTLMNTVILPI